MALLFFDGFDHYSTYNPSNYGKWTSYTGGNGFGSITDTPTGRGYAGKFNQNGGGVYYKDFDTGYTDFIIGFWFKIFGGGTQCTLCGMYLSGSGYQCFLNLDANTGTIYLRYGGYAGPIVGQSDPGLVSSSTGWHHIQWKVSIGTSVSSEVLLDSLSRIAVSGVDLDRYAAGFADGLRIGSVAPSGDPFIAYDDFYVFGDETNYKGVLRVDTVFPDAEGTYQDGTASTGSKPTCIDETLPSTSDYVYMDAANQSQSFTYASVPALSNQTIYGVQHYSWTARTGSGSRTAKHYFISGGTTIESAEYSPITSANYSAVQNFFETDPNTGSSWTEAAVNSIETGIRIIT